MIGDVIKQIHKKTLSRMSAIFEYLVLANIATSLGNRGDPNYELKFSTVIMLSSIGIEI